MVSRYFNLGSLKIKYSINIIILKSDSKVDLYSYIASLPNTESILLSKMNRIISRNHIIIKLIINIYYIYSITINYTNSLDLVMHSRTKEGYYGTN